MNIPYLLILTLPILLNIQGNTAILVFLVMNSIINLLMHYTQTQMKMLGSFLINEDKIDEQMQRGLTEEKAFKEYMENFDEEAAEEWIPQPIKLASQLSMLISILGILVGIVNMFSS